MTPKTQYQKMRDNRARRESRLDEFEPFSDTQLNGVRFKPGSLWDPARPMVATLEDGSVLTASGPLQNDPHHELRKTWAPGQRWQRREPSRDWVDTVKPSWLENVEYRRHPSDTDQEKPWYPDSSGEWVEVPDDCMECPVDKEKKILYLMKFDRDGRSFVNELWPAGGLCWDASANDPVRIVAYKVVA